MFTKDHFPIRPHGSIPHGRINEGEGDIRFPLNIYTGQSEKGENITIDNSAFNQPPTNMEHMEKIFSASVLGATFPNPTLVILVQVK